MLISAADRTVPVTVQARSPAATDEAFDVVAPIDLSRVFHRWGPFPGARGVANQSGPWDRVGRTRSPLLTDGSSVFEQLTEFTDGHSFAYELTRFTGPMRHLVRGVRGEWTFTPDGDGTVIRWTYELLPRAGRRPLLRVVVAPLWRRYMAATLRATVEEVARASR